MLAGASFRTIAGHLPAAGAAVRGSGRGCPPEWLAPGSSGKSITAEPKSNRRRRGDCRFCGIADSGTIVLHHSAAEGRRVITLLPDWHLCVLRASQVVETLPEYFDRCPQRRRWLPGSQGRALRQTLR